MGIIIAKLLYLLIGIITGVIAGLFGIGGGVIMVPILVYLLSFHEDVAQGISLAATVPISMMASYIHYKKGNLTKDLLWISLGAALGSILTSSIVGYLPTYFLKMVFSAILLFLAARMLIF